MRPLLPGHARCAVNVNARSPLPEGAAVTNMRLVISVSAVFLAVATLLASAQVQNQAGAGQQLGEAVPGVRLTTNRYTMHDRGQLRVFEVAMDELWVVTRAGEHKSQKLEPRADAEAVRQYANALREATGDELRLVLYEVGVPRTAYSGRVLTRQVLVQLATDADPNALAAAVEAVSHGEVPYAPGLFLFEAAATAGALPMAEALRRKPGVLLAEPQLAKQQQKRFLPNDPMFPNQWHLRNTGQNGGTTGIDVNITNAWDAYRGAGVMIGVVDDGLQLTHPDLSANVNTQIDWDFNYGDDDPSPNVTMDYHGTACAGVAAGRGNNSVGVSGAAPEAELVGLRLIADVATDSQEAAAMTHSNEVIWVKSNSWGPADDGATLEGPGPLTLSALAQGVTLGRGGEGTIYVWAGGNGLANQDNANYDGYANSIYTLAIAAVSDQGYQASYSEPGACLVVAAPSGSSGGQNITTTDLEGSRGYTGSDYTSTFSGTSAATALAAGVIAVILQANPNLGWCDLQEILIRSATKVSPTDSDWAVNGAGFSFNHKFGAGLISAAAAVNLAAGWTPLGPQTNISSSQLGLALSIPDDSANGITRDFDLRGSNLRVEHVTVTVNITHTYRGDLAITLTSPSGKTSRLAEKHDDSGDDYDDWKFMSVHHWGESSAGTWRVKVADLSAGDTGRLNSVRVDLYGTSGAALEVAPDGGIAASGPVGGPFTPSSQVYALSNSGGGSLTWTAGADQDWLSLSATSGALEPGASTNMAVSINSNANSLAAGRHAANVTFTNASTGSDRASRIVTLVVTNPPPSVSAVGDSTFDQCAVPAQAFNAIAIAAGAWHSLALRADGQVLAWGDHSYGQCAVPETLTNAIAIAAGGYHSLAIKPTGSVIAWGAGNYRQSSVPAGLAGVIGIAAGTWHSVALRADGTVVVWGDNSFGQTNLPAGLTNVTAVAAGGNHTLALKADGTVVAWGENTDAQGNVTGQSIVPWGLAGVVQVGAGEYHSLAVKSDGTVVAWGDNSQGQRSVPPVLTNLVAAAGGSGHSVALLADGTVAAWGANWSGQCDLPPALPPALGVAAGGYHTVVLLEENPPAPPRLLNPARSGGQFSALVQTLHRMHYALDFVDSVVETNWTGVCTNAGNGALRIMTDSGATGAQRFYRLRQW